MKRSLTPDELQYLDAKGYNVSGYKGEEFDFPDESSISGSAGRSALVSALPTAAGGAAFAGTMLALAPETLGASLLAIPAAAAMGYGGSKLASKIQEPLMTEDFKKQLTIDAQMHPYATAGGALATMPLGGFSPSPANVAKAGGALGRLALGLGTNTAERQALVNVGSGAALGGIQEAVLAPMEGREITAKDVGLAALTGGVFSRPNVIGKNLYKFHDGTTRTVENPAALAKQLAAPMTEKQRAVIAAVKPSVTYPEAIDRSLPVPIDNPDGTPKKLGKSAEASFKTMEKLIKEGAEITPRDDIQAQVDKQVKAILKKEQEAQAKKTVSPIAGEETPVEVPSTELKTDVAASLKSRNLSAALTPEYANTVIKQILNERGIQVSPDGSLPVNGKAFFDAGTRKVLFNPEKAAIDTLPHEGLHHMRWDLEAARDSGDKRAASLLEAWDKLSSPEMAKINAERKAKGLPEQDAHEFAVSQQGFEFVKQQLNLKRETPWKRWWNDTKALFNTKYNTGKVSLEDMRRAVNFKFVHERQKMQAQVGNKQDAREQPFGESENPDDINTWSEDTWNIVEAEGLNLLKQIEAHDKFGTPIPGLSKEAQARADAKRAARLNRNQGGMESLTYSPEDLAEYQRLKAKQLQLITEGKVMDASGNMHPEFHQVWTDFEKVRNRNNGMPPKQYEGRSQPEGEGLVPGEQEILDRQLSIWMEKYQLPLSAKLDKASMDDFGGALTDHARNLAGYNRMSNISDSRPVIHQKIKSYLENNPKWSKFLQDKELAPSEHTSEFNDLLFNVIKPGTKPSSVEKYSKFAWYKEGDKIGEIRYSKVGDGKIYFTSYSPEGTKFLNDNWTNKAQYEEALTKPGFVLPEYSTTFHPTDAGISNVTRDPEVNRIAMSDPEIAALEEQRIRLRKRYGRSQPEGEGLSSNEFTPKPARVRTYTQEQRENKQRLDREKYQQQKSEYDKIVKPEERRSAGVKPHTYPQDKEWTALFDTRENTPARRIPLSDVVNLDSREGMADFNEYVRRAVYTAANRIRAEKKGAELPPSYDPQSKTYGIGRQDYDEIAATVAADVKANGVDRDNYQGAGAMTLKRTLYRRARDAWKEAIRIKSQEKGQRSLDAKVGGDEGDATAVMDVTPDTSETQTRATVVPEVKKGMSPQEMAEAKVKALEEEREQAIAEYGSELADAVVEIDNDLEVWRKRAGREQGEDEGLEPSPGSKNSVYKYGLEEDQRRMARALIRGDKLIGDFNHPYPPELDTIAANTALDSKIIDGRRIIFHNSEEGRKALTYFEKVSNDHQSGKYRGKHEQQLRDYGKAYGYRQDEIDSFIKDFGKFQEENEGLLTDEEKQRQSLNPEWRQDQREEQDALYGTDKVASKAHAADLAREESKAKYSASYGDRAQYRIKDAILYTDRKIPNVQQATRLKNELLNQIGDDSLLNEKLRNIDPANASDWKDLLKAYTDGMFKKMHDAVDRAQPAGESLRPTLIRQYNDTVKEIKAGDNRNIGLRTVVAAEKSYKAGWNNGAERWDVSPIGTYERKAVDKNIDWNNPAKLREWREKNKKYLSKSFASKGEEIELDSNQILIPANKLAHAELIAKHLPEPPFAINAAERNPLLNNSLSFEEALQKYVDLEPNQIDTTRETSKFLDALDKEKYQPAGESLRSAIEGKHSFFSAMAPTFDKIKTINSELGDAFDKWEIAKRGYTGMRNEALASLQKFNPEDVKRVAELRREAFRSDNSEPLNLTGEDADINEALKKYYFDDIGMARKDLGLLIDHRAAGTNENYQPDMLNEETIDLFVSRPNSPEALYAVNKWAEYVAEHSEGEISFSEAKKHINDYIDAIGGKNDNYKSVNFGAIRKAQGYGLPDELRELDPLKTLSRYGSRAASDLAMFQELESKPAIAAALKIPNPNTGKIPDHPNAEMRYSAQKEVRNAMKWVMNDFGNTLSKSQPHVNAFVRLVHNSLLGGATGLRDLASVPVNMMPYIQNFSDLSAALSGMAKFREHAAAALRSGAKQPNLDLVQFNTAMDSPSRGLALMHKAATAMRKWQGREALENFSRDIVFGAGKELAIAHLAGAEAGDARSQKFIEKFGQGTEGKSKEEAANIIAANFTERNQGTYGGRGLPVGIVESQFAPFFSLQKWGVEKANTIYQDVFKPALTGENYLPLLTYSLGTIMTGAAIQEMNKLLMGRKPQDPDVKEALAKGDAKAYAQELATLMQLGNFSGIVGDVVKMGADATIRGKTSRNVVSFPSYTAVANTGEKLADVAEALRNGENPWEVIKMFSLDMMTQNIQNARALANYTVKDKELERSDKFRDRRVFNELEGKPAGDIPSPNKYLGLEERKFKQATSPAEVRQLLPQVLAKAKEQAKGNPEQFRRAIASLKGNSYQTVPSPTDSPYEFRAYYEFLVKTQGKQEADKRVKDYLTQRMLNQQKSKLLPSPR